MIFAGISVAVNVSLALLLFPRLGPSGIATAEITAGWVNAVLLFVVLIWRKHWDYDAGLIRRIPRLIIAAAIMATALYFASDYLEFYLSRQAGFVIQATTLSLLVIGSMIVYFATVFAIGGASLSALKGNMRGRKKAAAAAQDKDISA
jgi:putative peptidoglycan lipid II flippase